MILRYIAMGALLALVGCGAPGAPERPSGATAAPTSGVTISGEARIGVTGTL